MILLSAIQLNSDYDSTTPARATMSSPNLDEDDLVLLNHAMGDNTREECSWEDAHELLNSSVELLEAPGEYLKETDSDNSGIVSKVTLVIPQTMASAEARTRHLPMAVRPQQPQPRKGY